MLKVFETFDYTQFLKDVSKKPREDPISMTESADYFLNDLKNKKKSNIKIGDEECIKNETLNFNLTTNPYYFPEIVVNIKALFTQIPAWSNLMRCKFGSLNKVATSARSETNFSIIKNNVLENHKRSRTDIFLIKHIQFLKGSVMIGQSLLKNYKQFQNPVTKKPSIRNENVKSENKVASALRTQENWKNLIKEEICETSEIFLRNDLKSFDNNNSEIVKLDSFASSSISSNFSTENPSILQRIKNVPSSTLLEIESKNIASINIKKRPLSIELIDSKKRGKYLQPDPYIKFVHQRPTGQQSKAILKNGNLQKTRVTLNKIKTRIKNTCPFDSLLEILSSAYSNIQEFQQYLNQATAGKRENDLFNLAILYARRGVCNDIYVIRAEIIHRLIIGKEKPIPSTIDCDYNIARLFEKLSTQYNYSSKFEFKCSSCNYQETRLSQTETVHSFDVLNNGIQNLNSSLLRLFSDRKGLVCIKCKNNTAERKVELGNYLVFDTEYLFIEQLQKNILQENFKEHILCDLKDIPVFLNIKGQNYVLCGVVEFIPPLINGGTGHYVAYCRTVTNRWNVKDDCSDFVDYPKTIPKLNISIIFYVRCNY